MIRVEDIFSYSAKNPLLFNQYLFLFLFTVMFAGFTLLHKQVRARNFYLLLFSLFFYYKCSGWYFLLLLFSTILDYGCGFGIYIVKEKWQKMTNRAKGVLARRGVFFVRWTTVSAEDDPGRDFSRAFLNMEWILWIGGNWSGVIVVQSFMVCILWVIIAFCVCVFFSTYVNQEMSSSS